ncbi:MAG TPA: DNA internalization-related competence protein ComEC/Rec2 [Polyangiales bacterium]
MRTPIPLAAGFMLGLFAASTRALPVPAGWLALICLAVGLAFAAACGVAASSWLARAAPLLLALAAFGTGLCLGPASSSNAALPPAGVARLRGWVEEVRYGRGSLGRARVRITQGARLADGAAVAAGTQLWVGPVALPEGACISALATIAPRVPFRNPSPHPRLPNPHPTQGDAKLPTTNAFEVLEHPWPARLLHAIRTRLRTRFDATLDPDASEVARALILGDPDTLGDDDAAAVRSSGMAHVFAVSGMHVTLLAGLCVIALTRLLSFVPWLAQRFELRRIAVAIGIPWALAIAALTGGAPSGWRASITTALSWCLIACGLRPSAAAVTAFACLIFGALQPCEALRPAFLLSIAATAAIVAAPHRPAQGLSDLLRSALALSMRTTLATAPIVLWTFGNVPLVGVLANLLLVPVGSALLVLAAVHAAVATLLPPLAALTGLPLSLTSRAFLQACRAFAALGPAIAWPPPDIWQGATLVLGASVLLFSTRTRTRAQVGVAMLALLGLLELRLRHTQAPTGELRVSFLDVGQGDAALVDLPDGKLMLIDAGGNPGGGADPGAAVLLPLLRARRRDHLDLVVLTHPHPDHYGGLQAISEQLPIGELWDSGQAEAEVDLVGTSQAAAHLLASARTRGTRVRHPDELCGRPRLVGGALVEVLWPCPAFDPGYDANDNSLVLRVQYGQHAFLFAGDIEVQAERALLSTAARLHATVLKVPHHGSRTSSSAELLRAVAPQLAVVSAGAVNPFGHPHPEVMARLRASIPSVIDLGTHGGVIVSTDGAQLTVQR